MENLSDRDVQWVLMKSVDKGDIRITNINKNDENIVEKISQECSCDICGNKMRNCLEAYSYHIINDNNAIDVSEKSIFF